MCLSGQPALKARLAANSTRDGNEWARVVNAAPTANSRGLCGLSAPAETLMASRLHGLATTQEQRGQKQRIS